MPNYFGNFKIDNLNFGQMLNELETVLLTLLDKNGIDPKDFRLFKQLNSYYTVNDPIESDDLIEIASNNESLNNNINNKAISPSGLKYYMDQNSIKFANDSEVISGTIETKVISPKTLKNYVEEKKTPISSNIDIIEGIDNNSIISPSGLKFWSDSTISKYTGFKNLLINGNFDIWQRGYGPFNNTVFTSDRWFSSIGSSNGVQSVTRMNSIDNGSNYFLRVNRTTLGNLPTNFLTQKIEFDKFFCGQTVTVSFESKGTLNKNLKTLFLVNWGIGGSPDTVSLLSTISLNENWTKYSFTFTIPSIDEITIGTNPYFMFGFQENSDFSSFIFDIRKVQLELGSISTPYEYRPYNFELSLCKRYFERIGGTSTNSPIGIGVSKTTTIPSIYIPYSTKRIIPTLTFNGDFGIQDGSGTSGSINTLKTITSSSTKTLTPIKSENGAVVDFISSTMVSVGHSLILVSTTTTSYVDVDSEL